MNAQIQDIRSILQEARHELAQKPNVVATGIGYKIVNGKPTKDLAIVVSVASKQTKKALSPKELVPQTVGGIQTDVFPTGIIYAFQDPTGKFRPAPGGVSIGHINITAGTLGCLVQKAGKKYILSNNHVLANSNAGEIGDPILQPGPADVGSYPEDLIAKLSEFIPIHWDSEGNGGTSPCKVAGATASILNAFAALLGSKTRLHPQKVSPQAAAQDNLVDCAIAEPINEGDVVNEILHIGTISGVAEGTLGLSIQKSGRTTGYTTGTIQQIDVTVQVSYGSNKTATFVDQLMAGNMSAGGDSGSAILNTDKEIVGLLFAGSSNSTIMNRIQNVFDALKVDIIR